MWDVIYYKLKNMRRMIEWIQAKYKKQKEPDFGFEPATQIQDVEYLQLEQPVEVDHLALACLTKIKDFIFIGVYFGRETTCVFVEDNGFLGASGSKLIFVVTVGLAGLV